VPDKKLGQKLVLVVEETAGLRAAHSDENSSVENHSRLTRPNIKYSRSTQPNDKQSADKLSDLAIFSKASLSRVLQKHELPKEIIKIPSFPRNKSMKIDRNAVVRIITGKKISDI
jgi:acyl-CoA synthetase (AMP-forming)/AMP-acid ligase II